MTQWKIEIEFNTFIEREIFAKSLAPSIIGLDSWQTENFKGMVSQESVFSMQK